jgi:membrane associated rhomboid family serine protease
MVLLDHEAGSWGMAKQITATPRMGSHKHMSDSGLDGVRVTDGSRPRLVWVVFAVTAVITALGYLVPAFDHALTRDEGFFHGQVWRLVTPILLNPEGVGQLVINGVGLIVFGPLAERVFGPVRWAVLYLLGGLVGEVYSYAEHYYSAGSSVAIAGLLGGLAGWVISGAAELPLPARLGACVAPLGGIALAVLGDNHGTSILAGTLLGWALAWYHRRSGAPLPTAAGLRGEPAATVQD